MPWRPRATRSPRLPPPSPRPGVRPNSDPEAWRETSSSLRPAAAFSAGRRAQRPSRPAPLTHGGSGAVSGGDSLGPASSSLQTRGGHHGVCDQARCGPQRSRRREDARAVPRRREWGGGPRSLQPREKPAFAKLLRVQRDRKEKEKERKGERPRVRGAGGKDPGQTTGLSFSGLRRSAKAAFPRGCEPRANVFIHRIPLGLI